MQSDPIILSAQAHLEPGSSAGVNAAALKNPHDLPMELLWVRFSVYPDVPPIQGQTILCSVIGNVIGVKMDLGKVPVVDAGMPISCFGTERDDWDSDNMFVTYSVPTPAPATAVTVRHNIYTWRLKHPLLIPAGATLVPVFQHYGQVPFPVFVRVTYMCRSLERAPKGKTRWVPWVTSWRSKGFDVTNDLLETVRYDESSELDIVNPFDVPVAVARLTGRQLLLSPTNNYQSGEIELNPAFGSSTVFAELGDDFCYLAMKSSSGDEVVKNYTRFGALFPLNLKVWDLPGGWHMAPGEYLKIQLKYGPVDHQVQNPGRVQFAVGSVGYRRIEDGGRS